MAREDRWSDQQISEWISEVALCRQEESETLNIMVTGISVGAAILGILLDTSLRSSEVEIYPPLRLSFVTKERVIFWLSCLVFLIEFNFFTVMGYRNTLRYYYIRDLEDKLSEALKDTENPYLHYNEFIAPTITLNKNHINTGFTAFHFVCYAGMVVALAIFSMGMVITEFCLISDRNNIDRLVMFSMIIALIVLIIFFALINLHMQDLGKNNERIARKNKKYRINKEGKKQYSDGNTWNRFIKYLFYPRLNDPEKPVLLVSGTVYAYVMGIGDYTDDFLRVLFYILITLFCVDYCICQARLQVNDIRGFEEDLALGKENRLLTLEDTDSDKRKKIKYSIAVAAVRLVLGLALGIFFTVYEHPIILIIEILILASMVIYEIARSKGWDYLVFFLVGAGYPLRFIAGVSTVYTGFDMNHWLFTNGILISIIMWFYGSFSSVLAWSEETFIFSLKHGNDGEPVPKKHYALLERNIDKVRKRTQTEYVYPLRNSGNISDIWNSLYLVCVIAFIISGFDKSVGNIGCAVFTIANVIFILGIFARGKGIIISYVLGWLVMAASVLVCWYTHSDMHLSLTLMLLEFFVTGTYVVLRYQFGIEKRISEITGIKATNNNKGKSTKSIMEGIISLLFKKETYQKYFKRGER